MILFNQDKWISPLKVKIIISYKLQLVSFAIDTSYITLQFDLKKTKDYETTEMLFPLDQWKLVQ